MSEEIIKVLDDLSKRFGVAIDWSKENILPYVKELGQRIVKYNILKDAILLFCVVGLIVIIAVVGTKNDK